MSTVYVMRDGEVISVPSENVVPVLTDKQRLLIEAGKNIIEAPNLGFGGPTAKELFNGNR